MKKTIGILIGMFALSGSLALGATTGVMRNTTVRGWTDWESLGGPVTGDPAACTAGNWTYVVARGTDGAVWYRVRNLSTGNWGDWSFIRHGTIIASPAVTCTEFGNGSYSVDVVAQGTDRALWHVSGSGDNWGPWESLGGVVDTNSGPAISSNEVGARLDVFVRATNQQLYSRTRYNGAWTDWASEGGVLWSDPGAVMWSQNHLDVFVVGTDGQLWQTFMENGGWYPWAVQPGQITSSPDAISLSVGYLDVFARGPNNTLLQKSSVNGVWADWQDLGGTLLSGPGAAPYANKNRMLVAVRATDNNIWVRRWAP